MIWWIMLGGALGSGARHLATEWISWAAWQRLGTEFPWASLFVNSTGSLAIGLLAGLETHGHALSLTSRSFLMVGFMGGFTTFSTFSLQTFALAKDGNLLGAGANVILSFSLCLLFVGIGFAFTHRP